ncbi:MAG TPA: hypothetical protein VJX92_21250 [Methylomirabilota bacterium]|nr:hypothetical protein [Methylomirabilota bacterium]
MAIRIRPVDLDADQGELLATLDRNLPDLDHARRFKWMYRDSPLGPAWSWFAYDPESGRVVGVASVFRRALWIAGRVEMCGQVGDFGIDVSHRSLGPAVMLQRATFGPVEEGTLALCYDCPPDARGMSTFHRLGMKATTRTGRHARLLRVDRELGKRLGSGPVVGWIAPIGNLLLSLGRGRGTRLRDVAVARLEGRFGDEFTKLDERLAAAGSVRGRRAAMDLNWQYRDDPIHEYTVLTVRRRETLIGFAVVTVRGRDAFVVDMFGALDVGGARALLAMVSRSCAAAGAEVVYVVASEENPLTGLLKAAGFRPRSEGPRVVPYATAGGRFGGVLGSGVRWDLTEGELMA